MAVQAPRPPAPAAAAAARRPSVAPTAGATTAGATQATEKGTEKNRDFAETLTSEFQAAGDQSQGMHDDPRNAYRARKNYVLFIEIIMAVCVIALIVGTVVMFVVGSNTGVITLQPDAGGTQHPLDSNPGQNTSNQNPAPLGSDYYEEEVT
ncbi:hypothetical protein V5799_007550 [Amblyomma americanum]|uniref:Uncharacterized protein n=1 Tax=Amblyomma americanum TaxID=6943 RepID=A0AAQ4FFX0_AMBAM